MHATTEFHDHELPARPGVYGTLDYDVRGWSRWDGEQWYAQCETPDEAAHESEPADPPCSWHGFIFH